MLEDGAKMTAPATAHTLPTAGEAPVKALSTGMETAAHRGKWHKYPTQNQNSNMGSDWVLVFGFLLFGGVVCFVFILLTGVQKKHGHKITKLLFRKEELWTYSNDHLYFWQSFGK